MSGQSVVFGLLAICSESFIKKPKRGKHLVVQNHHRLTVRERSQHSGISLVGTVHSSSFVKTAPSLSQWFSLSDVKSGRVHLVLEWVPTASEPERLDQVWSQDTFSLH